jgi:hypothetical protein
MVTKLSQKLDIELVKDLIAGDSNDKSMPYGISISYSGSSGARWGPGGLILRVKAKCNLLVPRPS